MSERGRERVRESESKRQRESERGRERERVGGCLMVKTHQAHL